MPSDGNLTSTVTDFELFSRPLSYVPLLHLRIYATTQEAVANKMEVQRFIQANDIDDLDYDSIKSSVSK